MSPENPFAPLPVQSGDVYAPEHGAADAERFPRFAAKVIDNLIVQLVPGLFAIVAMMLGASEDVVYGVFGVVAVPLLLWQGWLLATTGQTVGKRWLKLRVVLVDNGQPPGWLRGVFLRHVLMPALAVVTCGLTQAVAVFDPLLIFRNDRRCLHDLIAGTRVVVA